MGMFRRGLESAASSVYSFRQRLFPSLMDIYPYRCAMLSNPGRVRKNNEDFCAFSREAGAFVVCDGMGGAAAGEIASRMAAETFLNALAPARLDGSTQTPAPDVRLDDAVHAANHAVHQQSLRSPQLRGMGTTLVGLLLEPAKQNSAVRNSVAITLAHVGDSRCYRYRAGALALLTLDHSLVEEQVRAGELTPLEAESHPMRNIITRAIGSQPTVEPDLAHLHPQPGDLYLLATDGLTRELSDAAIAQTFSTALERAGRRKPNLQSLCQSLIAQANHAGGSDNITVLLLHLPNQIAPEPNQIAPEPNQIAPEPNQIAPEPNQIAPED